jgi:hypothetical protein
MAWSHLSVIKQIPMHLLDRPALQLGMEIPRHSTPEAHITGFDLCHRRVSSFDLMFINLVGEGGEAAKMPISTLQLSNLLNLSRCSTVLHVVQFFSLFLVSFMAFCRSCMYLRPPWQHWTVALHAH